MAKRQIAKKEDKKKGTYGLFIPGGLLLGMGIGFAVDQLVAGMFIGLGTGFVLMALGLLLDKR